MREPSHLNTRAIGIDFGKARIGVSWSDVRKIIAMPLFLVEGDQNAEFSAKKLAQKLQEHSAMHAYTIAEVVVGMPYLMSGKKGFLAEEVERFILAFQQETSLRVISWDERLTSVQAERALRETNLTRKKRAGHVDLVAATIILQNYLDHQNSKESQ